MKNVEYWVEKLNLERHPEGGFFYQTYVAEKQLDSRAVMSSIYFLLSNGDYSAFHILDADETWYYHYGEPVVVVAIDLEGNIHHYYLGSDIENNEVFQITIPKGWIFASYCDGEYGIVGCAVSPAFEYEGFTLLTKEELMKLYPQHEIIYDKLAYKK